MRVVSLISVLFLLMAAGVRKEYRFIPNHSFDRGEKITFRVHYGFITAARAEMIVDQDIHYVNDRPCYKIDVLGRTVGVFDLALPINDVWGTYLDTAAIVPHKAYRYVEEGRYRRYEEYDFHQLEDSATVYRLHKETREVKKIFQFNMPRNVQDIVSGYYFFRTKNFDKMEVGSVFDVDGFLEDTVYNLKVRYLGKEMVKTKLGEKKAIVISPIMPENSLFDGENSIRAWFTDDRRKVPLKIKAEMFVGSVEIDIIDYQPGK